MKFFLTTLFTCLLTIFSFSQNIPSPDEFFPEKLGEHFYPPHLIQDYFETLAEKSDQIKLVEYGKTNQNRPLFYAIVSTKKNLDNLEQIRMNNLKRTRLLEGKGEDAGPAIVWLSFAVHGNEASSPNAAVKILYELISGTNSKAYKWLENAVVIMDPMVNPDGYARYTNWIRNVSNKILTPHPSSREHREPWPGGRVNHYLFDLNRDWAWATQTESRQRIPHFRKWMPHIHVDFHEQGANSPYYFAPAAKPYHKYITNWQKNFQTQIGKNNARYFDESGWTYFTKERFDLLYPSYGDTYPTFNGSIGMTYEQAGHGRAGRGILLENADTLRLIDRINHHTTTALSTIEISAANAHSIIQNFTEYFEKGANQPQGEYVTFIIRSSNSLDKIKRLCNLLDLHQIQYGRSTKGKKIEAYNYVSGKTEEIKVNEDDLIISAYQPMSVLAQVLFEPETFVEDSITYDITAWSLPYAHGLDAYAATKKILPDATFDFADPMGQIIDDNPYSYLFKWESLDDAGLLARLLKKEVKVRFATLPFRIMDQTYPSGTLIVNKADNKHLREHFHGLVQEAAHIHKRKLITTTSGFSQEGADFGSGRMSLIKTPEVLLVYGENVRTNSYGQLWHYFEQEIHYPFTAVTSKQLSEINLSDFNTIILADGRYSKIGEQLEGWIKKGGKLIAIGSAIGSLSDNKAFKIKTKEQEKKKTDSLEAKVKKYADQEREFIKSFIPGAVFKLQIDSTHPMAFGLPNYYFTLKTNSRSYEISEELWNVGYIDKNIFSRGFVGSKAMKQLKESLVFGTHSIGRGNVVYMVDNPLYRAFWDQGKFIFGNALFLVN